mgnify:CR=1 FL=1
MPLGCALSIGFHAGLGLAQLAGGNAGFDTGRYVRYPRTLVAPMAGVTVDPAHRLSIRRNLAAAATALPKLAAMQSPKSTHIAQLLLQRIRAWHQHSKAVGHAIFWATNRPGAPAWWPWAWISSRTPRAASSTRG